MGPEIVAGGVQSPVIDRVAVWITGRHCSRATQTAVIRPAWIETSAPKAGSLGSDKTCGAVQTPPVGRIEAWTTLSRPVVDTCHTATALPSRRSEERRVGKECRRLCRS